MTKLSKKAEEYIVVSISNESVGKEVIDAINHDIGDGEDNLQNQINNLQYQVDSLPVNTFRAGIAPMADGAKIFTVNFADIGTTNYIVTATVSNIVDVTVKDLSLTVTSKTTSSFSFITTHTTDHPNYKVEYIIIKL